MIRFYTFYLARARSRISVLFFAGTLLGFFLLNLLMSGCATTQESTLPDFERAGILGPTVLLTRAEPHTLELNRDLMPDGPAVVLTEVKDLMAKIVEVKLRFGNLPLEVPMENIGGNTWRAEFTPRQIKMLAVSGKTAQHDAHVFARNSQGQIATSKHPVEIWVKTPQLLPPRTQDNSLSHANKIDTT